MQPAGSLPSASSLTALATAALVASATVAACGHPATPTGPTGPTARAQASASAGAADGAGASPGAPDLAGATPGSMACGAGGATCRAPSELCCLDPSTGAGRCVARPPGELPGDVCGELPVAMDCDDAADCQGGQACCIQDQSSGDITFHRHECAPYPCDVEEVCLPGGRCLEKGFTCKPVTTELQSGGRCAFEQTGVDCGAARCSGQTPICCWDGAAGKGRCLASPDDCIERDDNGNPAREDVASFACRSPAECGGYPCAANFFMGGGSIYGCFSRWAVGDMGWSVLCRTVADCPDFGHKHPAGCTPVDTFPPGTGSCAYTAGE